MNAEPMTAEDILRVLRDIHNDIRDAVVSATEQSSTEQMSTIAADDEGDTIYEIDRVSEHRLVELLEAKLAHKLPLILIAEGLASEGIALPRGIAAEECKYRLIVDPIDGTRGLMYQKRSAWILSGLAPNKGTATGLQDIELAVMTEIPLVKQHLSDQLWAQAGQGLRAARYNRLTNAWNDWRPKPSSADSIAHGFAMVSRFCPGRRDLLARIDDVIVEGALGPVQAGKAQCFEDQYISTGGQLYELLVGHDRFTADLRPLIEPAIKADGNALGLCCHPYDCASFLLAAEAGIELTDPYGKELKVPLDLDTDVAWVAYANPKIRAEIEPLLQRAIADIL